MQNETKIAFIGAGNMAEAIISGLLQQNLYRNDQLLATNRSNKERLAQLQNKYEIITTHDKDFLLSEATVLILAVKPKDIAETIETYKTYIQPHHLIISVAAGVSTTTITELTGQKIAVIRSMPNTSAATAESATALSAGTYTTDEHMKLAVELFETVGTVSIVEEEHLHAVTGLSGSGPAYVYYLVEAMEKAALDLGLEGSTAKELILQTIIGSAKMLQTSDKSPRTLRKEVMSPNGTTEAGLNVLADYHTQEAMINCIKRAAERSEEMGQELAHILLRS
ncbi:pyrroline-5-carboxylate reductase ProI [Bacillus solimangrovi]|uniref:Pyrroline-5-carboxylate reductase n=1 Tax=Bacillus solimangrovi TaxID=1305675 RepID=A0A1E5LKB5_9BACI|nr:pyrroline-5-carboxylate reductase ProI [Bacillus solimangrovi]OEH94543.1 pyrroline-5-carboxylate reductase [Bacillus solimangrovi]